MLPQKEALQTISDHRIRRKRVALKSLKIFWVVLCLSGLVYQTVLVSEQYFSYLTTSEVTVTNQIQNNETLPAFTICVEQYRILNISALESDGICNFSTSNPKQLHRDIRDCRDKLNRNILNKYLNKFGYIREKLYDYKEFLMGTEKCLTIIPHRKYLSGRQPIMFILVDNNLFSYTVTQRKSSMVKFSAIDFAALSIKHCCCPLLLISFGHF